MLGCVPCEGTECCASKHDLDLLEISSKNPFVILWKTVPWPAAMEGTRRKSEKKSKGSWFVMSISGFSFEGSLHRSKNFSQPDISHLTCNIHCVNIMSGPMDEV